MNEQQIAYRIRQHLRQGSRLPAAHAERLKEIRQMAVSRHRATSRASVLAWADNVTGRIGGGPSLLARVVLPLALLVFGAVGINQWRELQQAAEIEEIDAAMLAGDLPIDAYLDKGFDAWLKRSSH